MLRKFERLLVDPLIFPNNWWGRCEFLIRVLHIDLFIFIFVRGLEVNRLGTSFVVPRPWFYFGVWVTRRQIFADELTDHPESAGFPDGMRIDNVATISDYRRGCCHNSVKCTVPATHPSDWSCCVGGIQSGSRDRVRTWRSWCWCLRYRRRLGWRRGWTFQEVHSLMTSPFCPSVRKPNLRVTS